MPTMRSTYSSLCVSFELIWTPKLLDWLVYQNGADVKIRARMWSEFGPAAMTHGHVFILSNLLMRKHTRQQSYSSQRLMMTESTLNWSNQPRTETVETFGCLIKWSCNSAKNHNVSNGHGIDLFPRCIPLGPYLFYVPSDKCRFFKIKSIRF